MDQDDRAARRARALRDNLRKRKARDRAVGAAEAVPDAPAAAPKQPG